MGDAAAERVAHAEYWDERYQETGQDDQLHEWFQSFGELEPFLDKNLFQVRAPSTQPRILHLGSGDSTIPEDFAKKGYENQLCVDFSAVVVERMAKRHAGIRGIEWQQGDVRDMPQVPAGSVDVAFDKGTLEAMIHGSPWNPPEDVVSNTSQYMREIFRVLKPDGVAFVMTFRQPHFIQPLLKTEGTAWDVTVDVQGGESSTFNYHLFTLKKAAA